MENEADIQGLVAQAQTGDQDSIAKLFHIYGDRIFRYVSTRVSSKEEAEDITQTVFLEMIRSLARYKEQRQTKFSTWLFQIARFRLIDHYRASKTELDIDDFANVLSDPIKEMPDPILKKEIEQGIISLPEKYASVLHLSFREDLPMSEVARVLQTNPVNARVIKHRALRALRHVLEQRKVLEDSV